MLKLLLLGPQGSGKGTQAELLLSKHNIPQISTGNIMRANIQSGTELGKLAKNYINDGKLVPDEIVVNIIAQRLKEQDTKNGFLLDGFPRNIAQAQALQGITDIDAALEIDIPDEEAIRRISGRRTCAKCDSVYHTTYNPPRIAGICDKCGSALLQRDDDKEGAIRKRLEIYHKETKPLTNFYKEKHIRIDGMQPIDKVFSAIESGLRIKKLIP